MILDNQKYIQHFFRKRRGLTNFELEKLLADDDEFVGCFSQDNLPTKLNLPATIIINTAKRSSKGRHWIAIRIQKNSSLYFDTFGVHPVEDNIKTFLQRFSKKILYSVVCIQDINSFYCGFYCFAFIKMVKNVKSFKTFLDFFYPFASKKNDKIVKTILEQ